jgi:hypothetical protein
MDSMSAYEALSHGAALSIVPAGRLFAHAAQSLRPHGATQRTKIWEIGASLHCSIIGTCLPNAELRALVRKFSGSQGEPTDHEIHGMAVGAVSRRDLLAKQIQKALDRRHKMAIKRFHAAASAAQVGELWQTAFHNGDIAGAYWAALTHPMADEALVKRIFGEVHMLSHQIGAANRADLRRPHQLEEEKAALEDKIARQERRLRDAITAQDVKIRELSDLASQAISNQPGQASTGEGLEQLVRDLRLRLDREIVRREAAEQRLADAARVRVESAARIATLQKAETILREELDAAEARLVGDDAPEDHAAWDLSGLRILYVGGRPQQVRRVRALVEGAGGELVHHDGGLEERAEQLYTLASHADVAVFPVDCVSHAAMHMVKKVCRQTGRPFVPLRGAGITPFLHALRSTIGQFVRQAAPAA